MIKTSIATIVLLISQTNAMDCESFGMDVEYCSDEYGNNSIELEKQKAQQESFADEYANNFKKLEKKRAQQDPSSEDLNPIRYWVFNQLDKVIPVTTYTYTATSSLFDNDNAFEHSLSDNIPKKHFTYLSDQNFFQLENSLKDKKNKTESKNILFPPPQVSFDSSSHSFFIEDNSKNPFGSIFIITKPKTNDFALCNIETISFHTIMDIMFNTDENSIYALLPTEVQRLIGFMYLELNIELPKTKNPK